MLTRPTGVIIVGERGSAIGKPAEGVRKWGLMLNGIKPRRRQ
jgi:hypothetical protein